MGAVEVAGSTLRRRLLAIRDHPEQRPWPPMADAQRVNDTLGEMWTVAPADMMRVVERMQDHLQTMELVGAHPSRAEPETITEVIKAFDDLREELVNLARAQTGERGLPASTFREPSPAVLEMVDQFRRAAGQQETLNVLAKPLAGFTRLGAGDAIPYPVRTPPPTAN